MRVAMAHDGANLRRPAGILLSRQPASQEMTTHDGMAAQRVLTTLDLVTFSSPVCVCAALRRATRAVTQLYDTVLAPTRLKTTQFILLDLISNGPASQSRMARDNAVSVEALSRRLGALRRKKLIELTISGPHGEHVYGLTDAGKARLEEARPYWQRAQARLQQTLGSGQLELVLSFADQITEAASAAESLKVKNVCVSGGDSA
jgi:DNA-binding MarR family transcriptional regulator